MTFNRTIKPESKILLNFNPPQMEILSLKNGLKVYFVNKDKLPFVRMKMIVNAGSKFDPENKYGLAFLTSMVIDEGADELDALQLSDEFDLLGSSFNVSADNDSINITLQSLSENFERSFSLFSKVLLKPQFNQEDFDREKKKLLTRIIQSKDEPEYLADQIFDRIILGDNNSYAYPVMGFEDSLKAIELNDAIEHYKKYFSPANSFLIIVGNISKDELTVTFEKYLSNWDSKTQLSLPNFESTVQPNKIFLHHKEGSVQTEIRVGHISSPRSDKDYFPKLLLNTILGGQFTSRINLNLRERNGYTYGAHSRFQYFKDSSYFQISTSVGIENTINAIKEIEFELNNIKNGVEENEVEFAKSSITKKFPMNFETYRQIVSSLSTKIFFNLSDDYFDSYIDKINSISKSDIDNAAEKFINLKNYSIILVGDKNRLSKDFEVVGWKYKEVDSEGNLIA